MKISVIIATYQRPQSLDRCLRSLLAQTRLPDEVIIGTKTYDTVSGAFLQQLSAERDLPFELRHVQVASHPVFVAENKGLQVASGQIVSFVDDDAEPYPDWLERIEAYFQDRHVGGVGGPDIPTNNGRAVFQDLT
ncbi:MAG: glycosyltransferase family 2 protein, partial [Anaerolineales bacterium]